MENFINVCFSSDNNYVQHLTTAMASILKNLKSDSIIRFYILDGGISECNKKNILELSALKDFECIFYDMSKFDFSRFPMNRSYISVATYYRLLILEILPKDIEKLIYLDCDIIVKDDLSKLYNIDISGYYAGVIEDEGSITQLKRLLLPLENNYFNAGVIVFNLKELRKIDFLQKCFEFYELNKNEITLQDQDILNGVFSGRCKFLPLRWNANGRLYRNNDLERFYTLTDEINAKNNPAIIHFTDIEKPWKKNCTHPLQNEYFKYKFLTKYRFKNLDILFFNKFITNIFSIKNIGSHKQIKIFGIKIKIKYDGRFKKEARAAKYLKKRYLDPYKINKLKKYNLKPKTNVLGNVIWQYWGQGIDSNTPEIVKKCLNSVEKYSNGYKRILLTNDNISEYLDLPDFVKEKLEKNIFNYTFFSDLLRCCILSAYGGIWIDATILLTDNIDSSYLEHDFFTFIRKQNANNKDDFIKYDGYYFSWRKNARVIWLSSFIVAKKSNLITNTLKDLLLNYWEKESSLIHYFTMHLMFYELIKMDKYSDIVTSQCDTFPHLLQINLKNKFDPNLLSRILAQSSIYKLTYKINGRDIKNDSMLSYILKTEI